MPRKARVKSVTGIYHIILRGMNRQSIFEDDEDRQKFLKTLKSYKEICGYSIYAYCLMSNHIHLLIKTGQETLEQIMKRIGASYVYWYNCKYERCGHLFQDRFRSEPVENDAYLLTVSRYIHQNPIKAGIVENIKEYRWSSYTEYIKDIGITDRDFILEILNKDKIQALKTFVDFMNQLNEDKCLEYEDKKQRLTDEQLKILIEEQHNIKAMMIQNESRETMERILKQLLKVDGVSTRQISRVTGISANILWRM